MLSHPTTSAAEAHAVRIQNRALAPCTRSSLRIQTYGCKSLFASLSVSVCVYVHVLWHPELMMCLHIQHPIKNIGCIMQFMRRCALADRIRRARIVEQTTRPDVCGICYGISTLQFIQLYIPLFASMCVCWCRSMHMPLHIIAKRWRIYCQCSNFSTTLAQYPIPIRMNDGRIGARAMQR